MKTSILLALSGNCALALVLTALCATPALTQTTATWTGGGDGTTYNDPLNWDIGVVPLNAVGTDYRVVIGGGRTVYFDTPGIDHQVYQFSLASGSTFVINPDRELEVLDQASIGGTISTETGSFRADSPASEFTGSTARALLLGSGGISIAAPSLASYGTGSGDVIAAEDDGLLDLSYLETYSDNGDYGGSPIRTVAARNGGTVNLSGLRDVVGAGPYDSLRFEVATGGVLRLDNLESLSGNKNVRFTSDGTALALPKLRTINAGVVFELAAGMSLELPSLVTFDGTGSYFESTLNVPTNGTVTANAMTAMDDVDVKLGDGGTLNATSLGEYTRGTLSVGANQTLNTGSLNSIDGSRIHVAGDGVVFDSVTATSYNSLSHYSSGDIFSAEGAGAILDLSSVETYTDGADHGGSPIRTVAARNGGTVDLSGLRDVVGAGPYDSLRFEVATGGVLQLDNLESLSGNRNIRITSDGTAMAMPNLQTINAGVVFELAAGMNLELPSLVTFDGTGAYFESTLNVPTNGTVTANAMTAMDDVDVSLGEGGTLNAVAMGEYTRGTLSVGANQMLNIGSLNSVDGSRIHVAGDGVVFDSVTATSYNSLSHYSSGDIFSAEGAGAILDLSTIETYTDNTDHGGSPIRTVAARNGGTVDLSNLSDVIGGGWGDSLRFEVATGGTLRLDNLESISGNKNVRFTSDGTALVLPSLRTVNAGVIFELAAGMDLNLPTLATFDGVGSSFDSVINIPDGGSLTAPLLREFTRATLNVGSNQTVDIGTLANIDGSRIHVSGSGTVFDFVTATSYDSRSHYSSGDIFSAEGDGAVLDLSSIETYTDNTDHGGSPIRTIAARNGGTVDLSNLSGVIGGGWGDSLRFEVATGGTLRLDNLESLSGGKNVRFTSDGTAIVLPRLRTVNAGVVFELAAGMDLNLPALATLDGAGSSFDSVINIPDGGSLTAPLLRQFNRATLNVGSNQTVNIGTLDNIDGSRIHVSGPGTVADFVTATSYDSRSHYSSGDIFSADGAGALLNLSSIETYTDNADHGGSPVRTIAARNGGTVDLSGVTRVVGGRWGDYLEFRAETGGTIDLSSLTSESENTRFVVASGGTMRMGDLLDVNPEITVTGAGSVLDFSGSVLLGPNTALTVNEAGEMHVSGSYRFQQQTESSLNLDSAVVRLDGTGGQFLEVGGENLGLGGATSGNFGIGQLVIGRTEQRTSVELIDAIDNGNRAAGGSEALYLYGLGGPSGLRILNDSALILNGLDVYAWDAAAGTTVHLNSLFDPWEMRIEYDDGYLQLAPLDFLWDDIEGGDFAVPGNWSDHLVPLASDAAVWNLSSIEGYTVQFGSNVATDSVIIKNDIVTFDLGGYRYTCAALHATAAFVIGQSEFDQARLTVENGTLAGYSAFIAAASGGSGRLTVTGTGAVELETDLTFGQGTGTLVLENGAQVRIGRTLDLGPNGIIESSGGTITVGTGAAETTADTVRIHEDGSLVGIGSIGAGVANAGTVAPGPASGVLGIAGDFTQTETGVLEMEIGGGVAGDEHDQAAVGGTATLGGTLALIVNEGFAAAYGDTLSVLLYDSVAGHFDSIEGLLFDNDLALRPAYEPDRLTLTVALPGDVDNDGYVGSTDLDAVRAKWGQNVPAGDWLSGDISGNGYVGSEDLDLVRSHWGQSAPIPTAVPEPSGVILLVLLGWLFAGRFRVRA